MSTGFRGLHKAVRVFLGLSLIFLAGAFQDTEVADEYTVKGMFVYNFTKYIDWSVSNPGPTFIIAVYGNSAITPNLRKIAANKKVNNRTMEIRPIQNLEEALNCQVIFIPRSANHLLNETIEKIGSRGILIITEDKNMAQRGSCINIITVDGKIKFELNASAAKRDKLKIASQLESLAIPIK